MEELTWINQWVWAHDEREALKRWSEQHAISANAKDFIGFIYVDRTAGMTLHVETFCDVLPDNTLQITKGPRDVNSRLILRYPFSKYQLTFLTDIQREALQLPQRPDWLQHYEVPHQAQLNAMRQLSLLHPLRAPGFPDDIKFMLPPVAAGQSPEIVWGRLEGQLDEQHFVCQLLNQPNQPLGYNAGEMLVVHIQAVPQGISCVCVGRLQKQ
jgi:hypothetical protein